jgi:hypothetical protein
MKQILPGLVLSMLLVGSTFTAQAQDENEPSNTMAEAGGDIVSAYIWRGIAFDNTPNIQAWGFWGYKNLMIGAWGSVSFNGQYFEPNLWMAYHLKNLSLTVTDVDAGFGKGFFNYKSDETAHILDASLAYKFSEKFPLTLTGSVIFYGFDKEIEGYHAVTGDPILGTKSNYSGYLELSLPLEISNNELEFTFGTATHESIVYGVDGFGIINVGAKISKTIPVTDKFSLPLSFEFIANPDANRVFTVFSLSF